MEQHTLQHSQVSVMSGSRSEIKYSRTTVSWSWRTLVKVKKMHCSAGLTSLLVADLLKVDLAQGTGTFPMEVEFLPAGIWILLFKQPEVRWWYVWTVEEVEWMGSTAVRYLIQWMLPRPYTLECTQQTPVMVSNTFMIHSCSVQLSSYCGVQPSTITGVD